MANFPVLDCSYIDIYTPLDRGLNLLGLLLFDIIVTDNDIDEYTVSG